MDCNLEILKEELINEIEGKIKYLKDKVVVFDLDGVLCKFKYTDDTSYNLLPFKNEEDIVNEYTKDNDLYKYAEPVKVMQYIISKLNIENVYILSLTRENIRKWKYNWIDKYYNSIKKENIIYTDTAYEKLNHLKELKSKYPNKEIVFVEDTADTLIKVNDEQLDIICIHISSFLK